MNPRVSRSSALASKATGFPIAKIAAKLAVGYTLDEIPNDITRKTPASFEPTLDYIVVKMPRWAFEKFPMADTELTTHMKSVGEAMAIGRTFKEAFLKAMRSRELDTPRRPAARAQGPAQGAVGALVRALRAHPARLPPGLQRCDEIHELTGDLARSSSPSSPTSSSSKREVARRRRGSRAELLRRFKRYGFSDRRLGELTGTRRARGPRRCASSTASLPVYKAVDTCAAEFEAETPYFYSTYEEENEAAARRAASASSSWAAGPNRIGQGIEFDYCCVHAAHDGARAGLRGRHGQLQPRDRVAPTTTSPTACTSSRSPSRTSPTSCANEQPKGVIVQFGGQTPLQASPAQLEAEAGIPILGTPQEPSTWPRTAAASASCSTSSASAAPTYGAGATAATRRSRSAERIGYPLLVRPSYVLGGRAMQIVYATGRARAATSTPR